MAKKHNCTVIFENEGYTFKPKSENNVSDAAMISGLMIYMNMGKALFGKRINYLMNLITNENWVKGQHEPILKEIKRKHLKPLMWVTPLHLTGLV